MLGPEISRVDVDFGPPIGDRSHLETVIYEHYRKWALVEDKKEFGNGRRSPFQVSIAETLAAHPITHPPPDVIISVVDGLRLVEEMLPDYVALISQIFRDDYRVNWASRWAGQEEGHSLALRAWRHAADTTFTSEAAVHSHQALMKLKWNPVKQNPLFADSVYALAYTLWQEYVTWKTYLSVAEYAERIGQTALKILCERLGFEEMRHHVYYRDVLEFVYRLDPQQATDMLVLAHQQFRMPGDYILGFPKYGKWTREAMLLGIFPINPLHERLNPVIEREDRRLSRSSPEEVLVCQAAREKCRIEHMRGFKGVFGRFGISMPDEMLLTGAAYHPQMAVT
jgi:hypothetical protein